MFTRAVIDRLKDSIAVRPTHHKQHNKKIKSAKLHSHERQFHSAPTKNFPDAEREKQADLKKKQAEQKADIPTSDTCRTVWEWELLALDMANIFHICV